MTNETIERDDVERATRRRFFKRMIETNECANMTTRERREHVARRMKQYDDDHK